MLPIDGLGMKYMQGGATSGNGFNSEEIVDISLLKNSLVLSINFRFGKNSEKVKRSNKSKEYESEGKGGGLF